MENSNVKNVILFLGNGFDLNMGLKTSYDDFVKYYLDEAKSDNTSVMKLKQSLKNEEENWCDLELQMGKLTSEFTDADSFYIAFCNMGEELLKYLINEEKKFELKTDTEKEILAQKFIEDILSFFNANNIKGPISINILTLNYTKLLYKFVSILKSVTFNVYLKDRGIIFNDVINCHGSLEIGKICFGVNNKSQIMNQKIFNNRPRVIQQLIKPMRSQIINKKDIEECKEIISNSDIIVNYGCSFGETDNYWVGLLSRWLGRIYTTDGFPTYDSIKDKITNNKKLYVYSHSRPTNTFFDATELEYEDTIKEKYFSADDERIKIIYENIFERVKDVFK